MHQAFLFLVLNIEDTKIDTHTGFLPLLITKTGEKKKFQG